MTPDTENSSWTSVRSNETTGGSRKRDFMGEREPNGRSSSTFARLPSPIHYTVLYI